MYGEKRKKKYSSVRGGCQVGVGTEEMREKPKSPYVVRARKMLVRRELVKSQKSPYNLFGVGSGVRRETGKEGFLRTWWAPGWYRYGGNERKAKISVQLVLCRWWSTERNGKRGIPPYVVGVREELVRRK